MLCTSKVLRSMKDASIHMMRSANMITLHGGKLMSNARMEHQVLILQPWTTIIPIIPQISFFILQPR